MAAFTVISFRLKSMADQSRRQIPDEFLQPEPGVIQVALGAVVLLFRDQELRDEIGNGYLVNLALLPFSGIEPCGIEKVATGLPADVARLLIGREFETSKYPLANLTPSKARGDFVSKRVRRFLVGPRCRVTLSFGAPGEIPRHIFLPILELHPFLNAHRRPAAGNLGRSFRKRCPHVFRLEGGFWFPRDGTARRFSTVTWNDALGAQAQGREMRFGAGDARTPNRFFLRPPCGSQGNVRELAFLALSTE